MSSILTTHGVRQLYQDAGDAAIRLQVLGVYRYLADPALKERLGQPFVDAHYVFDVLVSDGRHKMKAVLAPKCRKLVWTRELTARSLITVTKFKVFMEDEEHKHRIVLLQDVGVTSLSDDGVLPDKVVARRYGARQTDDQLDFISTVNPREVELLPLVGERLYYLPLRSDHYTLDWACSFTGGMPDEDSPLDELESSWSDRYGTPGTDDGQESTASSVAWNIVPDDCSDLFTPECKKLHTILEALDRIKGNNRQASSSNSSPPMLGAILDTTGVFEVMFLGAMCAKYYLSLHEGDLLQFRGYSSVSPRELEWTNSTSPLVCYPHDSSGNVYHVPKKYWKFLEMAKIAPHLLAEASLSSSQQDHGTCTSCNASSDLAAMYFDFVGVLSNVGRICRGRKRRLDEDAAEVTEYRWVKMIDSSSSHELVIKVGECSQPAVFRALEAGNTLMVTKLQWVIRSDSGSTVIPFHSLEECNLNVFFANNVRKNAVLASRKSLGESKLTAHIEKKYRPRNRLPTDVEEFKEAFDLDRSVMLLQRMEAFEHRHVGFIGQVRAISDGEDPAKDGPSVLLQLNEAKSTDQLLTVAVSINALYQRPAVKGNVKTVTSPEALPLIRLLPTAIVDEMYAKAFEDGPARSTRSKTPGLSLEFIEEFLLSSKRDFFFSLQLYRNGIGHVTWEVDAILAMP
ncbi:Nucleic acid-binding, OB-fold [Phytophthora cactorum]|nr:Nucleic acid-binding, OB-fold [Phytophthora cactorum]